MTFKCSTGICVLYAVTGVILCVFGLAGNSLVIWMAGFKLKKSVTTTWYLSLAISDFMFCFFLPFDIIYTIKDEWIFGDVMCKFWYFILGFNLFSSVFLLAVISMDRCVVILFPVWAQNKRTIRKASVIVMLVWIISAALSTPIAIYTEADNQNCSSTGDGETAEVVYNFGFGFVIPFCIIVICYVIILLKLKSRRTVIKKPIKIMTALIAIFMICWLPFHTFNFTKLNNDKHEDISSNTETICFILVIANSCLNPFLYAFMGKDLRKQCFAFVSKIENAFEEEETLSRVRGTALTNSEESNL